MIHDAQREWRLASKEPRVILTLVVVALLTVLALLTGWHRVQQRLERQQAIERDNAKQQRFLESAFDEASSAPSSESELSRADADRELALQMSARSPDLMRFTGGLWTAVLPVTPLAGIANGVSGTWPDHYRHAGLSVTQTLRQDAQPNPLLAMTGAYDMTLFVGVILPLAVVVLTFDVAAADRESGRWTLVQTQSRSVVRLVAMRCLLRVGTLAFVVGGLVVGWSVFVPVGGIELPTVVRTATLVAWLCGYVAFCGTLGFLVSSFRLSSAGSGIVLLLCWSVLVLFVPSFVERCVSHNVRVPDPAEFNAIEERARQRVEEETDAVWNEYLRQHPDVTFDDDNPQLEFILRDIANQHAVRSRVEAGLQTYFDRFLRREEQVDWSQLITPALAWRTVSEQYASTSIRHYIDFASATAGFHDEYIRYFEPMTLAGRELSLAEIRSLPSFDGRTLAERLYTRPLLLAGASMLAWTGLAGLIGYVRLRRTETTAARQRPGGTFS